MGGVLEYTLFAFRFTPPDSLLGKMMWSTVNTEIECLKARLDEVRKTREACTREIVALGRLNRALERRNRTNEGLRAQLAEREAEVGRLRAIETAARQLCEDRDCGYDALASDSLDQLKAAHDGGEGES